MDRKLKTWLLYSRGLVGDKARLGARLDRARQSPGRAGEQEALLSIP